MDFIRIDITLKEGYELRIGWPYLVEHSQEVKYFLHFIQPFLQDTTIIPYMLKGQIFIFQ